MRRRRAYSTRAQLEPWPSRRCAREEFWEGFAEDASRLKRQPVEQSADRLVEFS